MVFGDKEFATVVIPKTAHFELPRAIARKVLDVGQTLLVLDPASGKFVAGGPRAKAIASAVFDGDAAKADLWLKELEAEYNQYVTDSLGAGGATVFFIP